MKNFFCDIPSGDSIIFDIYHNITYTLYYFNSDFFYNNFFLIALEIILPEHGFFSYFYSSLPFGDNGLTYTAGIGFYIMFYIYGIFIGFLLDVLFYFLGKYLSKKSFFKNLKLNSKNFLYIWFRFIPIIGNISVLLGSILDKNHNKNDFFRIFIGNFLFIFINFLFGFTIFIFCGRFR